MRDEEHVIERCLNSVKEGLTAVAMVDTGSLDRSVDIVSKFVETNNLIGGVRVKPWRDFDRSRNDALEYSFEIIRKHEGFPPTGPLTRVQHTEYISRRENWYVLFIDADDILYSSKYKGPIHEGNLKEISEKYPSDISAIFDKSKNLKDEYRLWTRSGAAGFYFSRVFRINPNGYRMPRWHNPVHEVCYVGGLRDQAVEDISTLSIFSGRTGGRSKRGNKYLGDFVGFDSAICSGRIPPSTLPRTLFYMAQSCHDLKFYDQAIYYYTRRSEYGGNDFEMYITHMRTQEDYGYSRPAYYEEYTKEHLWALRLKHLWAAFEIAPHRREACSELGKYYFDKKLYKISWFFYSNGLKHDKPLDHDCFANMSLFSYQYLQDAYVAASWAGDNEGFIETALKVVNYPDVPLAHKNKAIENLAKLGKYKV